MKAKRGKLFASNMGYGRTFYADEPEDLAYLKQLAKDTRGDENKLRISKKIIAHLTRRQWARLWGQKHLIKPVFIPQSLGNGDLLLAVTPLNTRPNYYLIRIDARWLKKDDTETIYDHLDDIYDAIEDHVGPREWTDDDGNEHVEGWPALDLDSGTSWCDSMDLIGKKQAA